MLNIVWGVLTDHKLSVSYLNGLIERGFIGDAFVPSWPEEECSTSTEDMAATAVQCTVYKLEAAITQLLQLIHSGPGHGSRKVG